MSKPYISKLSSNAFLFWFCAEKSARRQGHREFPKANYREFPEILRRDRVFVSPVCNRQLSAWTLTTSVGRLWTSVVKELFLGDPISEGEELLLPFPVPEAEGAKLRGTPSRSGKARGRVSPVPGVAWVADEHRSTYETDIAYPLLVYCGGSPRGNSGPKYPGMELLHKTAVYTLVNGVIAHQKQQISVNWGGYVHLLFPEVVSEIDTNPEHKRLNV